MVKFSLHLQAHTIVFLEPWVLHELRCFHSFFDISFSALNDEVLALGRDCFPERLVEASFWDIYACNRLLCQFRIFFGHGVKTCQQVVTNKSGSPYVTRRLVGFFTSPLLEDLRCDKM